MPAQDPGRPARQPDVINEAFRLKLREAANDLRALARHHPARAAELLDAAQRLERLAKD